MNGANINNKRYFPQTSSYDYDAALSESGRLTPKYFAFRDVISHHLGQAPPSIPASPSPITIPSFALAAHAPLSALLGRGVPVERPRSMESFGQAFGYILYRTTIAAPARGDLVIRDVRDYAQVYVNGALAGTTDRRLDQDRVTIDVTSPNTRLDILVENSGRVNFAMPLRDERKGITRDVRLADQELTNWTVFTLPMSAAPASTAAPRATPDGFEGAGVYRGTFQLTVAGDTFLDTRGWGKGTVWINGHHLGRFWDIGPQQTLYMPGPWLRAGRNEIVVFSLTRPERLTMAGLAGPVYGS
jgi:beta-galactosidase